MYQNYRKYQKFNSKKEVDAKVEAFEKQLRSKYIKLMN